MFENFFGNRHAQIGQLQLGFERLLEKISDLTLGRRATNVQRMTRDLARSPLRAQQRRPNLRTIAMRKHDAVPGTDQANDLGRCPLRVCPLLGDGPRFSCTDEGVSADGKEHGLHKRYERLWLAPEAVTGSCQFPATSHSTLTYTCTNSCNSPSAGNLTNSSFISSSKIAFCACSRFSAC